MKITGIKYVSPFLDITTYGVGSANCIKALWKHSSIPITIQDFSFEKRKLRIHGERDLWGPIIGKQINYNIKIIHTPPPYYSNFSEPGIINIGFLYWETTHIPNSWVKNINKNLEAQFVCSQFTKKALLDSGVKVPVIVIPPGFEFSNNLSKKQSSVFGFDKDTYKFYAIAQWTERKNLIGLLKAYLTEFTPKEKVLLVLKTYLQDYTASQFSQIKQGIEMIKKSLRQKSKYDGYFPPLALVKRFLNQEEMWGIHNECDCLVLPYRGEGLGLVHAEAMAAGNPVISTALGGNTEFMNEENSFLIPYFLTPVMGMPWVEHYESDMYWAEPNVFEIKQAMRFVSTNKKSAKNIGRLACKTIRSDFSTKTLAKKMMHAIQNVLKRKT